jgi:hypothetical protein
VYRRCLDLRTVLRPEAARERRLGLNDAKIRTVWDDLLPIEVGEDSAQGFNPDRCIHIGRGIEWLRGDFQNVARWEPGHRLEAYATLACRRGCRWSADLPAGAFETSFHTPES